VREAGGGSKSPNAGSTTQGTGHLRAQKHPRVAPREDRPGAGPPRRKCLEEIRIRSRLNPCLHLPWETGGFEGCGGWHANGWPRKGPSTSLRRRRDLRQTTLVTIRPEPITRAGNSLETLACRGAPTD